MAVPAGEGGVETETPLRRTRPGPILCVQDVLGEFDTQGGKTCPPMAGVVVFCGITRRAFQGPCTESMVWQGSFGWR